MPLPPLESFTVPFDAPWGPHPLHGQRQRPAGAVATALLLHGGGQASGERFGDLRAWLVERGIDTVTFDCLGHGRTGGAQPGTTLAQREAQLHAVVAALALNPARLTVAGFSMGAAVAAGAAATLGLQRLCLAIPAAYAPEAREVPFGPAFSAILRRPRSWATAATFDAVARFQGHLLVVSAALDTVVPAEIPATYHARATAARSRVHHVIPGAPHDLAAHYAAHPSDQAAVYEAITTLCRQPAAPA